MGREFFRGNITLGEFVRFPIRNSSYVLLSFLPQDGWPPAPHCASWLKGHEMESSSVGLELMRLVGSYLLTFSFPSQFYAWICKGLLSWVNFTLVKKS